MKRTCVSWLCGWCLLLSWTLVVAEEEEGATEFPYTLTALEALIDTAPPILLLQAKHAETRMKESIWHDVSVSAGFNPLRTANKFTDQIRGGLAVSMPLDILLFRDTARVSREVEGLEYEKLRGELGREVRRLWYDRARRLVEIGQLAGELGLAQLRAQKVRTLLLTQEASLDTVTEAEVAVAKIAAMIQSKQIDVRDLEDGMLAVVGQTR